MTGVVIGSTIKYVAEIMRKEADMGGVVIGSSMKDISISTKKWGAIMVNTGCNQNCPTCYLGRKKNNVNMSQETASALANYGKENWDGMAVIGTEPLLDDNSVGIINIFAPTLQTHIMTNGVNLEKFADRIGMVERIDISLDGGPKTYYRNGDFQSILRGAKKWKDLTGKDVYALHMLNNKNCDEKIVEDMLLAGELIKAKKTIFSSYIRTIGGSNELPIPFKKIAEILQKFSGGNWLLIIDPYHAIIEWQSWIDIKNDVSILFPENLLLVDFDPGDWIIRIDINGQAHHPFMKLHPGIKLPGLKLF